MAKVTSKLQVTIPKVIAREHGIRPGDDVEWISAGDTIRIVPGTRRLAATADLKLRVKLYDAATERQRQRQPARPRRRAARDRGWKREDLYDRARSR